MTISHLFHAYFLQYLYTYHMNATIYKYSPLFNVSVLYHFGMAFFVIFPYSIYIGEGKDENFGE